MNLSETKLLNIIAEEIKAMNKESGIKHEINQETMRVAYSRHRDRVFSMINNPETKDNIVDVMATKIHNDITR